MKEEIFNIDIKNLTTIRQLNVDKIKSLEDVKRIFKFLNIQVEADNYIQPHGFEEVKDLFD
ncbi:TPA: hypothetical protein PTV74_003179 [Clostridium botulinum]|nr:hypothetical protein [Clostridium botulinum]HDK7206334.1 hypothetical protein [Clostridium botulinum]HDK7210070.1 hypothetical protein [Clostridium botulinum]HDK7265519.1 hypothetical protein [Clostridium botulinum]HDK7269367.1 hypothetical protein [Clostridium botulinum]